MSYCELYTKLLARKKKLLLNVIINRANYWQKGIGIGIGNTSIQQYRYWHRQYFLAQVLLLVLPIVFISIVNNPEVGLRGLI